MPTRRFFSALLLTTLLAGCHHRAPERPDPDPSPAPSQAQSKVQEAEIQLEAPRPLTLLHTNDMHAAFREEPAAWREDKALVGGFATLDATVQAIRSEHRPTLLLDGGDVTTGNPLSRVAAHGIVGWPVYDLMARTGYDAWCPGNHDLDQGADNLRKVIARLSFPTVNANFGPSDGMPFSPRMLPSITLKAGDLAVGVFGLLTPELTGVVDAKHIEGLRVTDPVEAARRQVALLDPGTDLIVALSHMGEDADRVLAAAVPGLDVIIGAHSHTRLSPPEKIGDTLIVQAGSHLHFLGRLDLMVQHDEVVSWTGTLIPLLYQPDAVVRPEIQAAVDKAAEIVDAEYRRIIGTLATPWVRAYHAESNVGDWVADRLRESTGTDVAFINSGGLRTDVPAGPLSLAALRTLLPFDNELCRFKLQGRDLRQLVQTNAEAAATEHHGILQVSGVTYTWTRVASGAAGTRESYGAGEVRGAEGGDGARTASTAGTARTASTANTISPVQVLTLRVGGAPLEDERWYTVGTNDFLLFSRPEKYFGNAVIHNPERLGIDQFEAVLGALESTPTIDAGLEGRIVEQVN